jgi:hypothetical protein
MNCDFVGLWLAGPVGLCGWLGRSNLITDLKDSVRPGPFNTTDMSHLFLKKKERKKERATSLKKKVIRPPFFYNTVFVFLVKESVHIHVQIQKHTTRIQRQLSQLNITEDPGKSKYYNRTPRTSETGGHLRSSSPTTAVVEDLEHHRKLKDPHRTLALKGVEVNTHPERQDEAVCGHPSTGSSPRGKNEPDPAGHHPQDPQHTLHP